MWVLLRGRVGWRACLQSKKSKTDIGEKRHTLAGCLGEMQVLLAALVSGVVINHLQAFHEHNVLHALVHVCASASANQQPTR
jgi:hypothetical protein